VLVNFLESLGFLSVFKAYHQVPGTDCAALRYETKSPRPAPGALAQNTAPLRLLRRRWVFFEVKPLLDGPFNFVDLTLKRVRSHFSCALRC
jgi:hypothetical protein